MARLALTFNMRMKEDAVKHHITLDQFMVQGLYAVDLRAAPLNAALCLIYYTITKKTTDRFTEFSSSLGLCEKTRRSL